MSAVSQIDPPVWRNPAFLRLWIAQAMTQTAQNAIWYALLVIVEEASHSRTALGITILSVVLPSVLFGLPAGIYVDKWDKRAVLVATNVARCLVVLGYVLVGSSLALLFAVSFGFSVICQFFAPAEVAVIPAIVGRVRLMQANSFFHLTFTASQLLGLVFFGPLIVKLLGITSFFVAMAVLYGISAGLVWRLPSQVQEGKDGPSGKPDFQHLSQLGEVVQLLRGDREMVLAMSYLTLGGTLTLVVAMLAPGYVVELGIAAADAVFVLAPAGIGMLSAAFVLGRRSGLLADRWRIIRRGLIVVSLSLFVAAALPALGRVAGLVRPEGVEVHILSEWDVALLGSVMVTTLVAGFGFAAIVVAAQTLLQERAPARARGRVFAVQFMLANLLSIIPLLFIGGLADLIGIKQVLMLMAITLMGVAFLGRRQASAGP